MPRPQWPLLTSSRSIRRRSPKASATSAESIAASSATARSRGVTVVDDYGHHPTEIRATLAAAREGGYRQIHVVFQPHRYTRTHDLLEQFCGAFTDADTVTVLPIYAASEAPIPGVTAELLANKIEGPQVEFAPDFPAALEAVTAKAHEGDLILTLGAGSVSQLAPQIVAALEAVASTLVSSRIPRVLHHSCANVLLKGFRAAMMLPANFFQCRKPFHGRRPVRGQSRKEPVWPSIPAAVFSRPQPPQPQRYRFRAAFTPGRRARPRCACGAPLAASVMPKPRRLRG